MVGAIFIGSFLPLLLLLFLLRHSRPVVAFFCWGMAAFLIVYLCAPSIYPFVSPRGELAFEAVFCGPPFEEFVKVLPLFVFPFFARRTFTPFLYILGMTAGIGFSIEENLNFLVRLESSESQKMSLMILRSFSTCLMHGVATGFTGYTITLARRAGKWWAIIFPVVGLIIASFYHGLFNWLMLHQHLAWGMIMAFGLFFVFMQCMKVVEDTAFETRGTRWE